MNQRIEVMKTYKLFINGAFPRSESGRTLPVNAPDAHPAAYVSRASRKDLRDAVTAARAAQQPWAARTAYNRGQILYRMAEMVEGKRDELARALAADAHTDHDTAAREVDATTDRLVAFAGWADKFAQVVGCQNPVAGPFHNFAFPEPTGVVAVIAPDRPALLGLVSLIAPPLCAGNAVVALGSTAHPLATAVLAEVIATSDVPKGAVNLLTGDRAELHTEVAAHRGIDAIHAAGVHGDQARTLRLGTADNMKRVAIRDITSPDAFADPQRCATPRWIEPFVEIKAIWHPSAT